MLISWDKDGGHLNGPVDLQLQLSSTVHVNVEIRAAEREGGGWHIWEAQLLMEKSPNHQVNKHTLQRDDGDDAAPGGNKPQN